MFPWQSLIKIKKNSATPVYLQIANAIIKGIHEGYLSPGQKLPGTRVFSDLLNLNRKTVIAAINELHSQGWVETYAHRGTFVSEKLPETVYKPLLQNDSDHFAEERVTDVNELPFLESLYLDFKNKIHIDDGVPDVNLAPLNFLFLHYRSLLSRKTFSGLLKYNHVEGDLDLRTTLKSYLHDTRGIITTAGNIFITRGSQMGIYLIIASLIKKGDLCITSHPGYQIVDQLTGYLGGEVNHVAVDAEGLVVSEVEELCKRKKIRLLYLTPHHHYPTTVTLSPQRRVRLLKLAVKYDFYILEDDYAYDFHYSNNPVLPLTSLDKSGRVIYIGSFSKSLSPSIRIGYFVAPTAIMEAANKLRRIIDRQGDPLLERSMSEFIKSGDLQRHLKKVVKIYKQRRDYFCGLLEEHLSGHINFVKPEGGMSVWVVFKKGDVLKTLADRLSEKGYFLETDNIFLEEFRAVRMGFASLSEKEMDRFVATLKGILSGT